MFSLLLDSWLPGLGPSDQACHITPSGITTPGLTALAWPRADFRLASLEFLIGLLATACPPLDDEAWRDWWHTPPTFGQLSAAFAPYAHAFSLDGYGPRFMQDFNPLPGEPDLPETLLIEAPGEATRRNNTALLNKPDRVRVLSRPAAAMALFTLQTYAPSGGRGNLTSVRGGGPLTTLVLPGREHPGTPVSLWHTLWANVPCGTPAAPASLARVLPWLAPTRTADRFPATTPEESDPLQAFWGMPRRIRLEFAPNAEGRPCDLTGVVDDIVCTGWRQRPNGVKYVAFEHPLSPYYKDAKAGRLPVHPQPGGLFYRHWVALATGGSGGNTFRAGCIRDWDQRARRGVPKAVRDGTRMLAGGFDMDNMKARSFVESEMPLPGLGDPQTERQVAMLAEGLIKASDIAARTLRMAIRNAVLPRESPLDSAQLATAYEGLWAKTQSAFFACLHGSAEAPSADDDREAALLREGGEWRRLLEQSALALFDEAAPLDPSVVSFDFKRIVDARRMLRSTLHGYGKLGDAMFAALALAAPEKPKRALQKTKGQTP